MSDDRIKKVIKNLIEPLAAAEHSRWAHWQRYVHSSCIPHGDHGDLIIPANLVRRWEEQIQKPYSELSEKEKESDRDQVRKYLPIIEEVLRNSEQEPN